MTKLVKISDLTLTQIASICDNTFLFPAEFYLEKNQSASKKENLEFSNFIKNAFRLNPYAICVRPERVQSAKEIISEASSEIKIASVVGFPDGNLYTTDFKISETKIAIAAKADEIDMVLNYKQLKKGNIDYIQKELHVMREVTKGKALLKLIFETSELNPDQIKQACDLAQKAKVDFIKTSTGFGEYGAKKEDVKIMRENFDGGIKISGGVNPKNIKELLYASSGRTDGYIDLDPMKIRIGESSLLKNY